MSNKELQKKGSEELVDVSMFEGMASGFEETSSDTYKVPFLKILQKQSDEIDKSEPVYVEGVEAMQYFNTATKQSYDNIKVVILKIVHNLIVWKPDRGGLVGIFDKAQENDIVARREGPFKFDAEANEVDDTISFYMMNADDPTDVFVFPVSKTSFKYGQAFATRLRALKMNGKPIPVTWAGIWNIGVAQDKNDKGSWYTMGNTPEFTEFVSAELVEQFIKPNLEMLQTAETDYSTMKDDASMKSANVEGTEQF